MLKPRGSNSLMANQGPSDSAGVDAEERVHHISCELSTIKARLGSARERLAQQGHVPAGVWQSACVIALLDRPDVRPAADFLVAKQPRLHRKLRGLEEELHHVYRGNSETSRLRMTTAPATKQEQAALERAKTYFAELGLCDRVTSQNVRKGIALMSGVVLDQMRSRSLMPSVQRKHGLQWLRRWRRRWSLKLGTFVPREIVAADEAQRKATSCRGMLQGAELSCLG